MFGLRVQLDGFRVKFVYEGHRVKVKVTGAKKRENQYSRNVKSRSTKDRAVSSASSMGFSAIADRTPRPLSLSRDQK